MITKELIKEMSELFSQDELMSKLIKAYFEEDKSDFRSILNSIFEERLNETRTP